MCWGTACWATCALGSERTCTSLGQPLARAVGRAQLVLIGSAQRQRTHRRATTSIHQHHNHKHRPSSHQPGHLGPAKRRADQWSAINGDQWSSLIDDHWSALVLGMMQPLARSHF